MRERMSLPLTGYRATLCPASGALSPGCSMGQNADTADFIKSGNVGRITAIHGHIFRNPAHGHPQWTRPILPDMTAENIIWKSFDGEAPHHEFDKAQQKSQ